ncbi:MAG TPA: FAD-dependent oxidoreductase [Candidatus Methylomirabilis sp.]|nr:FAD-dependent oxidoreductase [Candidatus Methylomirabilis sp.]
MIGHADVVVIGSGGLGAATAFNLARRGVKRVVLLDKHDLGSQTSPRAYFASGCNVAGLSISPALGDMLLPGSSMMPPLST